MVHIQSAFSLVPPKALVYKQEPPSHDGEPVTKPMLYAAGFHVGNGVDAELAYCVASSHGTWA